MPELALDELFARLAIVPGPGLSACLWPDGAVTDIVAPEFAPPTGVLAVGQTLLRGDDHPTMPPSTEDALSAMLMKVWLSLGSGEVGVALVPRWAISESTRLSSRRRHLLELEVVQRVVEVPDHHGAQTAWGLVVLGDSTSPELFRPVPTWSDPPLRWERTPIPVGDRWDVGPSWSALALESLVEVVGDSLLLDEVEDAMMEGRVTEPYVRALLSQQSVLTGLTSRLPLADALRQKVFTRVVEGRQADLVELGDVLLGRDPRDASSLGPTVAGMLDNLSRWAVQPSAPWIVTKMLEIVGRIPRTDAEIPESISEVYAVMADVADASATQDRGTRIALLTEALRRLERSSTHNTIVSTLSHGLFESVSRTRERALGSPTINFSLRYAVTEENSVFALRLINESQTPLFRLGGTLNWLDRNAEPLSIETVAALDPSGRWELTATWTRLPPGEARLQLHWTARDLLGRVVKGTGVLPVVVPEPSISVEQISELLLARRWDDLRALSEEDLAQAPAGLIRALLHSRDGDHELAAAALVEGATAEPDMYAMIACGLGLDEAALELATAAWEREPSDTELAMIVARLRRWSGDLTGAEHAVFRAVEFEDEAHALRSLMHPNAPFEVERTPAMDLAMLPVDLAAGRDIQGTLAAMPDLRTWAANVAWTVLELAHEGEAATATRVIEAYDWDDSLLPLLLKARVAHAADDGAAVNAHLNELFGNHDFRYQHVPLEPLPDNPYITGPPLKGDEMFFGRERELRRLDVVLGGKRPGVVLLEGERRTGKTSILLRVAERFPAALVVDVNLQVLGTVASPVDVWSHCGLELLRKAGVGRDERRAREPAGYLDFLDLVDEILPPGQTLLILVDEFEVIDDTLGRGEAGADVLANLRHLIQTRTVGAVVAGAQSLRASRTQKRSPLFGFGVRIRIEGLDDEAARALVTSPADGLIHWTAAAVDHVLALSDRLPLLLQHVCSEVWERRQDAPTRRAVTVAEVEEAVPAVLDRAEEHLIDIVQPLEAPEREVLERLAVDPFLGSGTLTDTLDEAGLNTLVSAGIVDGSTPGIARLRNGLLHRWLQENR